MSARPLVILGAGAHAREILDILETLAPADGSPAALGFVADPAFSEPSGRVRDLPILGDTDWLRARSDEVEALLGVGAPELKARFLARLDGSGVAFRSIVHPDTTLTTRVEIGDGVVIAAGCRLTTNIRLGDHVHLNLACTVSHDCVVESLAYLAPGVNLAGRVHVEEGAYLGIGASVIEGVRIGRWSIVGAGSTVIRDVPANSTVVGVPGREIRRRPEGWQLA